MEATGCSISARRRVLTSSDGLSSLPVTGSRYVHRRAPIDGGQADYSLDHTGEPQSNYVRWVADLCVPHLGKNVLDVGAGFGAVTQHIADGRTVTALDTSPVCVAALEERFGDNPNARVVHGDLSALDDEQYDSALLTNVLEHIFDDSGFLAELRKRLTPAGTIVVYVPALNWLYTGWDHKVGHYRRYSKRRLRGVFHEAHLAVTHLRYANMLAIPAWAVSGLMVDHKDRHVRSLDGWDHFAVPVIRGIETQIPPPIGLNLLGVGQAPKAPLLFTG